MSEVPGARLTLIHGRKHQRTIEQANFESSDVGPQASLFPKPKPGVVLFVSFPEIEEREFVEVIELARPGYVFDLRLAPRFDIGRLNRQRAFDLFESTQTHYVDFTTEVTAGLPREDALIKLRGILGKSNFDLSRPVVFLLGLSASSVATDSEVLAVLSDAGKKAAEVVQIPRSA